MSPYFTPKGIYSVTLVMAPFSAPCTNLANFANTPDV
jgi:hypothetical protein